MKIGIIGAGPAGLTAAIELGKANKQVYIFEKGRVGENIICAEGFFDYFSEIHVELPEKLQIRKLIVQDDKNYEIPLPKTGKFYTFDRKKWQLNLADKAIFHGVKVIENTKIDKKDINSLMKDFDYLIDASGVKGVTHSFFPKEEVKIYRKYLMPTIQYKIKKDFSIYKDTIKVILLNDPPGYFWLFPRKSNGFINLANVGLGLLSKKNQLPNLKSVFSQILAKENIQITDEKIMSGPIPTKRIRHYKHKKIILSGDALGLCSPLHGGGIDTAYLSGFYIAKSIEKEDFIIYEKFLKSVDLRFFIERVFLILWEKFGSHRILSRLKNKGLFKDSPDNIPLTKNWYIKALLRLVT